jgi:hypothetical protein
VTAWRPIRPRPAVLSGGRKPSDASEAASWRPARQEPIDQGATPEREGSTFDALRAGVAVRSQKGR